MQDQIAGVRPASLCSGQKPPGCRRSPFATGAGIGAFPPPRAMLAAVSARIK